MVNLLLSKFETYLLDEEFDLEFMEQAQENDESKLMKYEEYPAGFFTSL